MTFGLLLSLISAFSIFGTEKEIWGLIERPTIDYGSLSLTIFGVIILFFAIFRMEPRGRFFGGSVE